MMSKGAGPEAQQYLWRGAIPLQIHLHDSQVTTLPPPPPDLILGPHLGYLPLLVPQIKPFFNSALPSGVDTVWFEYKDTFRGYAGNVLIACEGEDSVKWSFINALKEIEEEDEAI